MKNQPIRACPHDHSLYRGPSGHHTSRSIPLITLLGRWQYAFEKSKHDVRREGRPPIFLFLFLLPTRSSPLMPRSDLYTCFRVTIGLCYIVFTNLGFFDTSPPPSSFLTYLRRHTSPDHDHVRSTRLRPGSILLGRFKLLRTRCKLFQFEKSHCISSKSWPLLPLEMVNDEFHAQSDPRIYRKGGHAGTRGADRGLTGGSCYRAYRWLIVFLEGVRRVYLGGSIPHTA